MRSHEKPLRGEVVSYLWVGNSVIAIQTLMFRSQKKWLLFLLFIIFYFILLCNTVLVLPYINMNPPRVYTCSQSWTPPPTSLPITSSLGHPSAPAPSILYPASNLDWQFVSYMIVYMFQCHSPKSSHPPIQYKKWLLKSFRDVKTL